MPLQILLSGFGPFGNVVNNPTERLLAHFADHAPAHYKVTICPLRTSFTQAPATLQAMLDKGAADGRPFDVVLMLGVAAGSRHWRVETQGLNWDDPRIPDVDGQKQDAREICPGSPARLPVTLPPDPIERAIEAVGAPVVLSLSAGSYLCNHLLYRVLHSIGSDSESNSEQNSKQNSESNSEQNDLADDQRAHGSDPLRTRPLAGFLHVPADELTYGEPDKTPNTEQIGAPDAPASKDFEPVVFPFTQHVAVVEAVLTAISHLSMITNK